ncbi:hypothetical protein LguiA_032620 [Lonicera macranthoides]
MSSILFKAYIDRWGMHIEEVSGVSSPSRGNKGISIVDLILRTVAVFATLASAVAMGTTNQTLPFFTQSTLYSAQYNDLPSLSFFVIANSVVSAYLALSLSLSILHIIRSRAKATRAVLIFFDTAMMGLLTAGGSAAAAIVYLAHKGNASANWVAICQQFSNFCERISGSLIGSFGAIIVLMVLILLSAIALSRT